MDIAEANTRLDELTGLIEVAKTPYDFNDISERIRDLIYKVKHFNGEIQVRLSHIISGIRAKLPLRNILFEPEFGPEFEPEEEKSLLTLMKVVRFGGVILPPSATDGKHNPGKEADDDNIIQYPRTELICELLYDLGVNLEDCTAINGEEPTKDSWRVTPYVAIVIPQLDRTIFVCNEEENATFVLFTSNIADITEKLKLHKFQLARVAKKVAWSSKKDHIAWQTRVKKVINGDESQLSQTETQSLWVDGEEIELRVHEGRVRIPVRHSGGEATILIDGNKTVVIGLKAYLRITENKTKPAKIKKLLKESGVDPVEGVCLWSSSQPHDAYIKCNLSVLEPVPFDRETGVATYTKNNNIFEAISVGHYARSVARMPESTLNDLIRAKGLEPIKGVNVKIVDKIYDRTAVDLLIEQYKSNSVPSDKGYTVAVVDGEAIEVVVAKVYYTALGGEKHFGVNYKNFFYHLSNRIKPVKGLKLAVQDVGTGALLSAYQVYKRSDFDTFASKYLQK